MSSNKLLFIFVALLASVGGAQTLIMTDGFETADTTCWLARPDAGGTENTAGCYDPPQWLTIANLYGPPPGEIRVLRPSLEAHTGDGVVLTTFPGDESLTKAQYNLPTGVDHIYFTQWIRFPAGFDFPFGEKVFRADMWDSSGDVTFASFIAVIYNQGLGTSIMGGMTLNKNGGENYGYADGITFAPNSWHKLEYEIKLNTPCLYDGYAYTRLDDSLITSRTGMGGTDMRPSGCDTHHISFAQIGGWRSNNGVSPAVPQNIYVDDVSMSIETSTPRWGPFGENDIFLLKMGL